MSEHTRPTPYQVIVAMSILAWLSTACTDKLYVDDIGAVGGDSNRGAQETDTANQVDGFPDAGVFQCRDGDATVAVDLVIALDNSAGMEDEAAMVRDLMNPFAGQLGEYGVDFHITLITGGATPVDDKTDKTGVCVDAPLGSGACPADTNLPGFLHVQRIVESRNALSVIVDTHNEWKTGLRNGGALHFLVISDDNSDIDADAFREKLASLDPAVDDFFFHAIAAMTEKKSACDEEIPSPCCDFAAHEGVVYKSLTEAASGLFEDLCLQDFETGFRNLALDIANKSCPEGSLV